MISLFDWVMTLTADDLPAAPWTLRDTIVIANSSMWLERLKDDVGRPGCARGKTGALQADLRALRAIVKGDEF